MIFIMTVETCEGEMQEMSLVFITDRPPTLGISIHKSIFYMIDIPCLCSFVALEKCWLYSPPSVRLCWAASDACNTTICTAWRSDYASLIHTQKYTNTEMHEYKCAHTHNKNLRFRKYL